MAFASLQLFPGDPTPVSGPLPENNDRFLIGSMSQIMEVTWGVGKYLVTGGGSWVNLALDIYGTSHVDVFNDTTDAPERNMSDLLCPVFTSMHAGIFQDFFTNPDGTSGISTLPFTIECTGPIYKLGDDYAVKWEFENDIVTSYDGSGCGIVWGTISIVGIEKPLYVIPLGNECDILAEQSTPYNLNVSVATRNNPS